MAGESDRPETADEEDWDGTESASQRSSAIQGHTASTAEYSAATPAAGVFAAAWRCTTCDSPDLHRNSSGDWVCSGCGGLDYYRVNEQTWRRTGHGTWMYFPEGQEPPPPWLRAPTPVAPERTPGPPSSAPPTSETAPSSSSGAARRRRRRRHGGRPDPDGGEWREQAESETPTHDTMVTVSSRHQRLQPDPRLPGLGPAAPALLGHLDRAPGGLEEYDQGLLGEHPAILDTAGRRTKVSSSSPPSWTSRMGPERGVRWRGGTAPLPPKWSYDKEDLRAFAKYERKVRLWEIQVEPFMSKREAANTRRWTGSTPPKGSTTSWSSFADRCPSAWFTKSAASSPTTRTSTATPTSTCEPSPIGTAGLSATSKQSTSMSQQCTTARLGAAASWTVPA